MPKDKQEDEMSVDFRLNGDDVQTADQDDDLNDDLEEDFDDDDDDSTDDSDDEDDSTDDDGESENESDDDAPKAQKGQDGEKPAKKKQTAKERIEELAEKRRVAEKEAFDAEMARQAAERRTAELEAELAESKKTSLPKKPDPKDFVYGDVDPEYQDALVEYRVAEKMAETQQQSAESSSQDSAAAVDAKYAQKVETIMAEGEASTKRHPNFKKVVEGATFDAHLARLIADSEKPVDIAYFLANNLGELLKVTKQAPEERARTIGRLEGRFSARSAARKQTKAPDPMRRSKASKDEDKKYGPSSQDDFDKAFFG